jgi:phage tail tape-measure protein
MAYNDDPFELSPEEQELLREAESAQSTYGSIGSALGSIGGGLAGAATGLFSAGTTTIPAAMAGASLGGAAFGALGNWLGGNRAAEANRKAAELKKRREEAAQKQATSNISDLLGPWLTRGM